jgi:purine nucleosidase
MYGKLAYKGAWTDSWEKYNSTNRTPYHDANVIPAMREGTPTEMPQKETATSFMLREVHHFPNEVTIMALGPETNVALAVRLDDDFASLAKELVLEGASFNPRAVPGDSFSVQFANTPRASTNFWWDPEAAHIVLHAPWKKITVVPIDATTDTKLTDRLIQDAAHSYGRTETPIQKYVEAYANLDFPMWDEAAFALWRTPSLIVRHDALTLDIDTNSSGSNYGGTLSWAAGKGPGLGEANVDVIREINVAALDRLFVELISK